MFVYKIDKGVQEMDDGANPHLGIIGRIVKFLKEMWHRLPFVQKEDVTEDGIIQKLLAKYDAPKEQIAKAVAVVLDKLRGIGAIEE